jgi:hypothetical protein
LYREVFKDAFAPPAPSQRVKAWDRAPVSAHAPRLQGQKVWKRVGLKTQLKADDKENRDAETELQSGGLGARKRPRVRGGNKEDISDARWKMAESGEELGMVMLSPKKQRMSLGLGDMDAFVVPRKRTNANHLITPRKPRRKMPLAEQNATVNTQILQQAVVLSPAKLSPQKIPLNDQAPTCNDSIASSPAKSAEQKIPLNDSEDAITAPVEKPVRRRKSVRRSTRRLTRGTTPEQPPAAPAEDVMANQSSEAVRISESGEGAAQEGPQSFRDEASMALLNGNISAEKAKLPEVTPEAVCQEVKEESLAESQHEAEPSVECPSASRKGLEVNLPIFQQEDLSFQCSVLSRLGPRLDSIPRQRIPEHQNKDERHHSDEVQEEVPGRLVQPQCLWKTSQPTMRQ